MNAILEQINSTGYVFVEFALPMLVQSSVLIAVLLLADLLLRKKVRAVFRYWLWMLVLLKLILPTTLSSPVSLGSWFGDELATVKFSESTPAEPISSLQMAQVLPSKEVSTPPPATPTAGVRPIVTAAPDTKPVVAEAAASPAVSPTPVTWQGIVFVVWAAGVAAMGLLLLQRAIFVCGLVAQAKNPTELMNDAFRFCCRQMGLKGKVSLKVSPNTTSPAVCGLFRPVILVPQNLAPTLGSSRLRPVLLHELAHISRGDLWVNLAQTILQIIYFYNPLLWLANSVIRRIREQAVDEAVQVAMGAKAKQYPQTLVDVAKMAFSRPALSLRLIGVVESKSQLKSRIKRMLNRPIPKTAKLGILGLIAVLIFAAVLLPMAKAQEQQAKTRYSFVTVTEGLGFDDIVVGDANCTGEFIKSRLGEPDKEVKNEKDWWLNYRETSGLGFWVNPQENVLIEIRLNKKFKGKLTSGISMSSTKQDVFDTYGKPIEEKEVRDLTKHFENQVLYETKGGFFKPKNGKIFYGKNGLLFWFEGNEILQIVIHPKEDNANLTKRDVEVEQVTKESKFISTLPSGVTVEPVRAHKELNEGKKEERPDISTKRKEIAAKLATLNEHRDRVQRDLDSAERALAEVRDRWGFIDLEERSYPHPVTERLNRLQREKDDLVLEISQLQANIKNLREKDDNSNLIKAQEHLVELQARLDTLEKMLAEAAAQKRSFDMARTHYKQRAAIRDERLQRLNELKSQIEKLRLMYDNPEAFNVEIEVEETSKAGIGTIDVAVEDFKIRPYPAGGLYTVTVAIRNKGSQEAPSFRLNFYQGDPANNLNLHGKPQTGSHGAGPIKPGNVWNESSSPFVLKEGLNEIVVVLDTDQSIAESDETNNQASMRVVVKDGRIIEKSVSYSPLRKVETSRLKTNVQLEAEGTGGKELEKIVEQAVMTISTCAETDPRVKQSLESLQGLDENAVVKELVKFLDSDKNTVRRSAIYILWKGGFKSIEPAVPGLQKLCSHKEYFTRGMAALALGAGKVERSFDTLCNMTLNDSSAYARRCAAYALGLMGNPEAKDVLEKALKDSDSNVRNNAEAALTMLSQAEKPISEKTNVQVDVEGSGENRSSRRSKNLELSNDDGSSAGRESIAGGGHAVRFKAPNDECTLKTVRIYGSRYGEAKAPKEDFHIWLCDNNFKVIEDFPFPYSKFKRGAPEWVMLRVKPTKLPKQFIICADFDPHRTKGVYVHYDAQSSGNSLIALPGQPSRDFDRGDWMIRAVLADSAGDESLDAAGLQDLIHSARPGATVTIPRGVYTEPIEINKSLTLKGESRTECILEVTANKSAIFIDTKGKGRVTIEDLTIKWQLATSDKNIEYPFALGVKDSRTKVKNCNFVPLGNFKRSPVAIRAVGFSNLTIDGCRFEGFGFAVFYNEGTEGAIRDSLIMNCQSQGITIFSGATVDIVGNIITGSNKHAVRNTGGTLRMKDNLIINNANRGVYLGNKSASGTITNNIIMGNGTGISGFARSKVKIENNLCLDNSFAGIDMRDSCSFLIRNNILNGNARGLALFKETGKNSNKIGKNTFWQNKVDAENFRKTANSITAEPRFVDPDNGDFSLKPGPALEHKQGLTNPQVFKTLWKIWQNRANKNEPFSGARQTNL